jgi:hypothetical protein
MGALIKDLKRPLRGGYPLAVGLDRQECLSHAGYFIMISFFTAVKVLPEPDAGVAFIRMK